MYLTFSLGPAAPIIAAYVFAIVVAGVTWNKHRFSSSLIIVSVIGFFIYRMVLPSLWSESVRPWLPWTARMGITTTLWCMLCCAALAGRSRPTTAATRRFQFQIRHALLGMVYAALVAGYANAFINKHSAIDYFGMLSRCLPLLSVWAAAAIIAVVRYRWHWKASTLIVCGTTMLITLTAMAPILQDWRMTSVGSWNSIASLIRWLDAAILSPIAFFLIVAATLADRKNAAANTVSQSVQPGVSCPISPIVRCDTTRSSIASG